MNESNDQKDLTLEQAVQIVSCAVQSGTVKLPGATVFFEAFAKTPAEQVSETALNAVLNGAAPFTNDVKKLAKLDAVYLRALVFALANKELS